MRRKKQKREQNTDPKGKKKRKYEEVELFYRSQISPTKSSQSLFLLGEFDVTRIKQHHNVLSSINV